MKALKFTLLFLFLTSALFAQTDIAVARTQPVGSTVSIKGIVLNGSELGLIKYIQDETGGIAAYSSALTGVKRGDSIAVTGVLKQFNNLLEIDPVNSHTVISSNNPLPAPKV
ncbi:MAG: hypothetical protein M3Q97_06410, partial [Bacteroidota bacterium]|nr:hypothetical protein [Bacteroidota bacterium]